MMTKQTVLGCALTSFLISAPAWSESTAVGVADLGCGPAACGPDGSADIIHHDPSTGGVTLHYLSGTGIDLLESDFTLDGVEIVDGGAGDNYEPGQITFSLVGGSDDGGSDNSNSTSDNSNSSDPGLGGAVPHDGGVASASYEVFGRISDLAVVSSGCDHTDNLDAVGAFGVTSFDLSATATNANGSNCLATAYVAPQPAQTGGLDAEDFITAFRVVKKGLGDPNDNFIMSINPTPTELPAGVVRVSLDDAGRIETILHDPGDGSDSEHIHQANRSIDATEYTPVDDRLYYFNQVNASGWGHGMYENDCNDGMIVPKVRFLYDNGDSVNFSVEPEIELLFGGQVMHVALVDPGDGFTSPPEFTDGTPPPDGFSSDDGQAHTGGTSGSGLQLSHTRSGPIHEIKDFNAGSGYNDIPTLTIVDPGGAGTGAEVTLLFTEAFEGGPRDMSYVDSGETILLPGSGWQSQAGDFDGDGNPDLLWRNKSLGASMIWLLENGHVVTTNSLPATASEWNPTVADLDADGRSEIFWWNSLTGSTVVWRIMPDATSSWVSSSLPSDTVSDITWKVVGETRRFGRQSILWQNTFDGTVGTWTMSTSNPSVISQNAMFTYPNGDSLVPGSNWRVIGTSDLNGDGLTGDLLWQADEYHRIAIWLLGNDNFLEGDYLTYNGQEVIMDAGLGGIGTYTVNGHVNLVWNDGLGVVNWQMDRGTGGVTTPEGDTTEPGSDPSTGSGGRPDEDGSDGLSDDSDDLGSEDESTTQDVANAGSTASGGSTFIAGQAYRLATAWRMGIDGTLTPYTIEFFAGLPEPPAGGSGSSGGIGGIGGDLGGILDGVIPDTGGGIGGGDTGGGGIASGGITIPDGVDPCDYICGLNRDDPSGWPPEFTTPPPSIVQGIWDILIDGLLDSYGCDPCSGGGGGGIPDPTGACCSSLVPGACDIFTEEVCLSLPGTTWLGEDTECDECP
ncbi:MAG: VCBS repeat-containing protein [Phycisphaerales bacterium]|nr:VCBS repeat-containing protein [Phycisphaerales bacterium]